MKCGIYTDFVIQFLLKFSMRSIYFHLGNQARSALSEHIETAEDFCLETMITPWKILCFKL